MRRALAILILCLLSHQLLLTLGIVTWYEWNKDYVAQNLCINRAKPELKCCGKCYLRKQLAKAEGSSQPDKPLAIKLTKGELSPFILPGALSFSAPREIAAQRLFFYSTPFAEDVTLTVLHPPG